jgi:hypothetical protein
VHADIVSPGSKKLWMAANSSASTGYQMTWWVQAPQRPFSVTPCDAYGGVAWSPDPLRCNVLNRVLVSYEELLAELG